MSPLESSGPGGEEGLPDLAYAVALARLPGVGPATLRRLLASMPARECHARLCAGRPLPLPKAQRGAARADNDGMGALRGGPAVSPDHLAAAARRLDVAAGWHSLGRAGIAVLRPGDAAFPGRLAAGEDPPPLLFCLGRPPEDSLAAVAIVGTRSCTHYGEEVAGELAAALAASGVVVVSGLAAGIDAAAHSGVLASLAAPKRGEPEARPMRGDAAAGLLGPGAQQQLGDREPRPLAIVGGGVDVVYPPANRPLWRAVARHGAILSEAPPGSEPAAWRFPERNRVLAAASDVVVVVESHRRGGSLMTAEAAMRRQVAVGAVPGSVRSPASEGCNDLLADGAHVVRDVDDVLTLLGLARPSPMRPRRAAPRREGGRPSPAGAGAGAGDPVASERHAAVDEEVLRALEHRPVSLDAVLARTGLPLLDAVASLERLLAGGVARRAGAGFELAR